MRFVKGGQFYEVYNTNQSNLYLKCVTTDTFCQFFVVLVKHQRQKKRREREICGLCVNCFIGVEMSTANKKNSSSRYVFIVSTTIFSLSSLLNYSAFTRRPSKP